MLLNAKSEQTCNFFLQCPVYALLSCIFLSFPPGRGTCFCFFTRHLGLFSSSNNITYQVGLALVKSHGREQPVMIMVTKPGT